MLYFRKVTARKQKQNESRKQSNTMQSVITMSSGHPKEIIWIEVSAGSAFCRGEQWSLTLKKNGFPGVKISEGRFGLVNIKTFWCIE
jgi:hypothetical protein